MRYYALWFLDPKIPIPYLLATDNGYNAVNDTAVLHVCAVVVSGPLDTGKDPDS